jgi:hypothetical protein
MDSLQVEMNQEIDMLIAKLQFAKSIPGYRTKVAAVERVKDQVEGFVAFWDCKLDKLNDVEI